MTDNAVRAKLQRYVEGVTPAQLPPFTGVAERRRTRRVRVAASSSAVAVVVVLVLATLLGGGGPTTITARPTTSPTGPSIQTATELKRQLIGPRWYLAAVDSPDTYWRSRSSSDASLSFGAVDFTASDGCGGLKSAVAFGDGAVVTLGGTDAVRSACAVASPGPPQGTLPPQLFLTALDGRLTAAVVEGVLTLTKGSTVLTLTARTEQHDDLDPGNKLQALLTSHTWQLHRIVTASKTWGDPQPTTLQFGAHGYTINPDCNDHVGAVSYVAGQLVMRFFMATAMGCAAAETVQARSALTIDALFSGPVSVEEDAGLLMLWNDKTTIELHQGPPPKGDPGPNLPPPSVPPATVASAASSPPDPGPATLASQLSGVRWMLRSITVDGKAVAKASNYGASLTFAGDAYHVDDGCNTRDGTVAYQEMSVTMTAGSQTAAYCQDRREVTDAQKYAGAFAVKVDGTVLTLSGPSHTYVFDVQGHAFFASQLVGTDWRLVSWSRRSGAHQVPAGVRAGISFEDGVDRYVSLSDGCNTDVANGDYNGAHVKLLGGQVTSRACAAINALIMGNMRLALDSDVSAAVTPTTLSLNGNGVYLVLERSTPKYEPLVSSPTTPSGTPASLVGPTFMLRQLSINGVPLPRVAAVGATVTYTQTAFTATDGCNTLSGSVSYTGDALIPGADVAGTAMGCEGAHFGSVAQPFDALISARSTVVRQPGGITLSAGGTVAEMVVEDPASLGRDLLAGAWRVTSVTMHAGDVRTAVDASRAGITFSADGFLADDGCNSISGAVAYGAVSLTFSQQVQSAAACAAQGQAAVVREAVRAVTQGESSYGHQAGQVWISVGDVSIGLSPVLS